MRESGALPTADADPLCWMGAAELGAAYACARLSPVEVARVALDRAEAIQGPFNAFTRIEQDGALIQASASEARWRRGEPFSPVDGVPTTIKDIVWVAGWPIRYGSLSSDAAPCATDAPAVARMRAAGLVFLGLTATPEFGWKALTDSPLSGVTRNPWNPSLTPGGSSGGAAVAAATGAGVFHLGTDGGGSIRVPCAFTGLVGLKPTYGRVPAYPASAFGTVAHLGPMTRRVDDARHLLAVMAGTDPQDWLQGPAQWPSLDARVRSFEGMRIGFWATPPCGTLDPEIDAAIRGVVSDLEDRGAWITRIDPPGGNILETFTVLWATGAAALVAPLGTAAREALDPDLRAMISAAGAATLSATSKP